MSAEEKRRFRAEKKSIAERRRETNKLKGTYIDPRKNVIHIEYPKDGPNALKTGQNINFKNQKRFSAMKAMGLVVGGRRRETTTRKRKMIKAKNNRSRRG